MNILIIKTGALGDVVRTSFIAQALKDKYRFKKPKIYWITDPRALPLFNNNPYIDKVIDSEKRASLNKVSFDLVINLEEDIENCRFASSIKASKIIGAFLDKGGAIDYTPESSYWFNTSRISKLGETKADKLKKENKKTHRQIMAEMIGIKEWEKYTPFLRLTDNQRKLANNFLRRYNLSRREIIVGINTGAADTWPKALSVRKTADLINTIYKKYKAKILLFGGPNELERNREIHKYSRAPIIDTGCGNDLLEFPALVSVCNIFITSDSLGMHIALSLKRKSVVLVGPTSPAEIDMYNLGEKILANSNYVSTYRHAPKNIMDKLNLQEVYSAVEKLIQLKITLLITAFEEPNISKALDCALNQKTNYEYQVILSAPDEKTLSVGKIYQKKYKNFKLTQDPGKGKSFALNKSLKEIKTDILILTDGDVYMSENSVEDIANLFLNPEIGAVTGRPIPVEGREKKYGFWANFLFNAAHRIRKQSFENSQFIECSGYLFAFRKDKINKIPLDVAEDTVIPYILWQKGFQIGYSENSKVYVKNPNNFHDWIKQKIRTHKSHEKLYRYVDTKTTPKVKSFKTECRGIFWALSFPKNFKEFFWMVQLIFARFYTWMQYFFDIRILQKHYQDAWERVESTK